MSDHLEPSSHPASQDPRGRDAERPSEIPKRGWKEIALRVWKEMGDDKVGFSAAGIAFYILMGFVPMLGAALSLYGLFADTGDVESQLAAMTGIVPTEAMDIIAQQLKRIASSDSKAGLAAAVSLLLAVWGGSQAMDAMITALNIAYDEKDHRSFLRRKALGLLLTFGAAIVIVLAVALLVIAPLAVEFLHLGKVGEWMIKIFRWPLMLAVVSFALALLYRWAPDRENAKWRWITPGTVAATLVWMIASAGFSWYAGTLGNYAGTYGSLGGIVVLLFWFYITGYVVMMGAEVNAEIEHQTAKDSTTGPPKPLGERGAFVADDVADIPK